MPQPRGYGKRRVYCGTRQLNGQQRIKEHAEVGYKPTSRNGTRRQCKNQYLSKQTGNLIHTYAWQLRGSRSRLRQRKQNNAVVEAKELEHMQRRLREWERRIHVDFRRAIDALFAKRMGIRIVEVYHWYGGGTEAGCMKAIRRLQGRGQSTSLMLQAPYRHTETD